MAGRVPQRPRPTLGLQVDEAANSPRNVAAAVSSALSASQRDHTRVDLVVGQNRIRHGLGRAVEGYSITPTAANATFAHAIDETNPHPEREVWITVVGIGQPKARIEIW
jgi:hypothetical protein